MKKIAIATETEHQKVLAQRLAKQLHLPIIDPASASDYDFLLVYTKEHLELRQIISRAPGPIFVDFLQGALARRGQLQSGRELSARAIKIKQCPHPTVLDVTAGLGRDAFLLACLGCKVHMCERSPVIAALLEDGLQRLKQAGLDHSLTLLSIDARTYLSNLTDAERPDIIYLDPMFSARSKTALVKKEMRFLREIVGDDDDAEELFLLA